MAGKKGAKKTSGAAAQAAPRGAERSASGHTLYGSVFHGGRMYSSKRKGDAEKLAAALENEKDEGRRKANAEGFQKLADDGRVEGFGTKASAKGKAAAAKNKRGESGRVRADAEAEGEGEVGGDPDEQAGGGVDVTEDPELDQEPEE